ncbi:unnamed protein product [Closterium sp. Naga37s-1]|nr:unnamed protein product [Closterium sp. Naga37s-1]
MADPGSCEASLKDRGNAEFKAKNFLKAAALYTQAIKDAPDSHALYSNRSAAFLQLSKLTKALADAEAAIRLNPAWEKGYYRKGCALEAMKRYDEALEAFREAAERSPGSKSNAGESNAGESNAGESNAGESNAGESNAGESNAGESNAGESIAGESNAGESKVGKSPAAEPPSLSRPPPSLVLPFSPFSCSPSFRHFPFPPTCSSTPSPPCPRLTRPPLLPLSRPLSASPPIGLAPYRPRPLSASPLGAHLRASLCNPPFLACLAHHLPTLTHRMHPPSAAQPFIPHDPALSRSLALLPPVHSHASLMILSPCLCHPLPSLSPTDLTSTFINLFSVCALPLSFTSPSSSTLSSLISPTPASLVARMDRLFMHPSLPVTPCLLPPSPPPLLV